MKIQLKKELKPKGVKVEQLSKRYVEDYIRSTECKRLEEVRTVHWFN